MVRCFLRSTTVARWRRTFRTACPLVCHRSKESDRFPFSEHSGNRQEKPLFRRTCPWCRVEQCKDPSSVSRSFLAALLRSTYLQIAYILNMSILVKN